MSPRPHLLVTGFGPFPRMPRNPSAALASRVAASPAWRIAGIGVTCRVLTTAYRALEAELAPALQASPDAVLMIGVAGRDPRIRVETRATGRRSMLFADAAGRAASRPIATGETRRTRLAPVKALRCLRAQALPSRLSRDAGRYLCNAAYHRALATPHPVLFIHIPMPPRAGRRSRPGAVRPRLGYGERLSAALVAIGRRLVVEARFPDHRPL